MGKSHQAGWVVLRGKRWYGYFRRRVLDPQTEQERVDTVCVRLDLKTQMTKFEARDALRAEIDKQAGQQLGDRIRKDSSVTFGWFVRNRYFPLREGDWRPETAKIKKIQIEQDLLSKFEGVPLDMVDRFMLQTHLNNLATRLSQDRVKHARSYLKSIFDEAIGQDFLLNDPTRKLKVPNRLRPKDKQVLTWGQLRDALQKCNQRDRALLMLDMTSALRPSELFALRWRSFDNRNTLSITETVYKGQIRPFGKTRKSLGDIGRRTPAVEADVSKPFARCVHVFEFGRWRDGYRQLPEPGSQAPRGETEGSQTEFPDSAPNDGHAGAADGIGEGHSGSPAALEG
jgi:hypothetical protein